MPPLSATQETLPVTHLVGYSPTESSLLVTSSIAKGMDVMSQSGALPLSFLLLLQLPPSQSSISSAFWLGEGFPVCEACEEGPAANPGQGCKECEIPT